MKNKSSDITGKNSLLSFLILTLFVFTFGSCKKNKEMISTNTQSEISKVEDKIKNTLSYQTFQSKMSVTFNDGKNDVSVSAQIKVIKGHKIQISIQPLLGIEVFKIEITNDSLKVIDKINKRYIAESYKEYRKQIPLDLNISILENLFLNKLFIPGNENFEINDFDKFKWRLSQNGDLDGVLKNTKLYDLSFHLNNSSLLTKTNVMFSSGTHRLDWNYSMFQDLEGIDFP